MSTTLLGEILTRHNSDKANPHAFDEFYSKLFPDRNAPLDIMEIGVAGGQSIRAFHEYFPNARIVAVDVERCEYSHPDGRIDSRQIEQTDIVGLWDFIGPDRRFDWIIDDASHIYNKQILTLVYLYPALKPGGYYCIEDVSGYAIGNFQFKEALEVFKGKFYNLNREDKPDGGQLFVVRKPMTFEQIVQAFEDLGGLDHTKVDQDPYAASLLDQLNHYTRCPRFRIKTGADGKQRAFVMPRHQQVFNT